MSRNWENIIWHNADNTWGIGFYERISRGNSWDADYDSEWDDDYDHDRFAYAANGFATEEFARRWWTGVNPGSFNVDSAKLNVKDTQKLADMVRAANDPVFAKEYEIKKAKADSLAFNKVVRERLRDNEPVQGKFYNIRISRSTIPAATGVVEDFRVMLKKDGDWLGFENSMRLKNGNIRKAFVKVWNTKTRMQAKNIIWATEVVSRFSYLR